MNDRLYRSRDDRMLAGVAGGLAEMWDVDPSLVRIVWALLVIFTGGIALLVYLVMAIVVPEADVVPPDASGVPIGLGGTARPAPPGRRAAGGGGESTAFVGGVILILLGAFFLAREWLPRIDLDWVWPLVLVGIGVALLVSAITRGRGGPA